VNVIGAALRRVFDHDGWPLHAGAEKEPLFRVTASRAFVWWIWGDYLVRFH
jgi:hypothetical protein